MVEDESSGEIRVIEGPKLVCEQRIDKVAALKDGLLAPMALLLAVVQFSPTCPHPPRLP